MTNYQSGTRFEHHVRDHLRDRGYVVIRSAGSKTPVDLVAIDPAGEILLTQCKANGLLSGAEWEVFRLLKTCEHVRVVLASKLPLGVIAYHELTGPRVSGLGLSRQPNCHEFLP